MLEQLHLHQAEVRRGDCVRSFHAWSLIDNLERSNGHTERYGLIYVDYRDQAGIVGERWASSASSSNRSSRLCEQP
jgi:beta-glucosidase